jgi:hypothetical protein
MFRHFAPTGEVYRYITLGGTELRDCRTLHFIDERLTLGAISFEADDDRYPAAHATANRLRGAGPNVEVVHDNFFRGFTRANGDRRHLFFADFENRCAFTDYDLLFGRMFRREQICENDLLLITSYLGGRMKNLDQRIEQEYDPEFRILGVTSAADKHVVFRACHPSFTLCRALRDADMQDVLDVRCFGFVAYMDTSPMGLYGYTIGRGVTRLREFLNAPRLELYGRAW